MTKSTWTIRVTATHHSRWLFVLDGAIDHASAVIEARAILPTCEVDL